MPSETSAVIITLPMPLVDASSSPDVAVWCEGSSCSVRLILTAVVVALVVFVVAIAVASQCHMAQRLRGNPLAWSRCRRCTPGTAARSSSEAAPH